MPIINECMNDKNDVRKGKEELFACIRVAKERQESETDSNSVGSSSFWSSVSLFSH